METETERKPFEKFKPFHPVTDQTQEPESGRRYLIRPLGSQEIDNVITRAGEVDYQDVITVEAESATTERTEVEKEHSIRRENERKTKAAAWILSHEDIIEKLVASAKLETFWGEPFGMTYLVSVLQYQLKRSGSSVETRNRAKFANWLKPFIGRELIKREPTLKFHLRVKL